MPMGRAGIVGEESTVISVRKLADATIAGVKGEPGGKGGGVQGGASGLPQGLSHTCPVCWASGPSSPSEVHELGWYTVGILCLLS